MVQCPGLRLLVLTLAMAGVTGGAGGVSPGQPHYTVQRWGREAGLPDDRVTAVLQTRDGFLWVGTRGGLARFDGSQFRALPLEPPLDAAPIQITALSEDTQGRLWVGTQEHGLRRVEGGRVVAAAPPGGPVEGAVTSLAVGLGGEIWVGTARGLARRAQGRWSWLTTAQGLPSDAVTGVHAARSGTVWITTRGGMCLLRNNRILPMDFQTESPARSPEFLGIYEDRSGVLWAYGDTYLVNLGEGKRFNYFRGGETPAVRIWTLCEGRQGEFWIGTSGQGLFSFADGRFQPLIPREGRLSSDVRALCEDREGNLWLGTHGDGLLRLRPSQARLVGRDAGLPPGPARALAVTLRGRCWAGFEQGGLWEVSLAGRFPTAQAARTFPPGNLVTALATDLVGGLWAGTGGAGLWHWNGQTAVQFTTAHGLPDDSSQALAVEADGTLWVAPRQGGLARLTPAGEVLAVRSPTQLSSPITTLAPARQGGVWAGTAGGGLLRADARGARELPEANLGGYPLRALHEDAEGWLWIGTAGGGLGVLAGPNFMRWDRAAGWPDNWVLGVTTDDAGHLWFSTPRGVWRVARGDLDPARPLAPPSRRLFTSSEVANAVPGGGGPMALRGPEGELWFALAEGVLAFSPAGMTFDARVPVFIEDIRVNGELLAREGDPREPGAPLRLPARLRSLELSFSALDLSATEPVRCQYQLEGFDPDWMEAGAERRARYGRLPYGDYRFRVRVGDGRGGADEPGARLALTLPLPWWRGPVALALYAAGAAALIAGVARVVSFRRLRARLSRLAQQQALQRERMRIAQDMHDEIGSKLTKISFLSERARGDLGGNGSAAGKLETIANTSRDLLQSLDEIVWAVNPHNDSLEHLAAYLGQYASEYLQNTAVECELRIPRDLPEHPLTSETRHNLFLAFEEALNNVLKHSGATRVRIEMAVTPGRFRIALADDGRGFDPAAPAHRARGGNGLTNLRQRLADIGGHCVIASMPGEGARVTLEIPLS